MTLEHRGLDIGAAGVQQFRLRQRMVRPVDDSGVGRRHRVIFRATPDDATCPEICPQVGKSDPAELGRGSAKSLQIERI